GIVACQVLAVVKQGVGGLAAVHDLRAHERQGAVRQLALTMGDDGDPVAAQSELAALLTVREGSCYPGLCATAESEKRANVACEDAALDLPVPVGKRLGDDLDELRAA